MVSNWTMLWIFALAYAVACSTPRRGRKVQCRCRCCGRRGCRR